MPYFSEHKNSVEVLFEKNAMQEMAFENCKTVGWAIIRLSALADPCSGLGRWMLQCSGCSMVGLTDALPPKC